MKINLLGNGKNDIFELFCHFCVFAPKYRLPYVLNYQDLFIFAKDFSVS